MADYMVNINENVSIFYKNIYPCFSILLKYNK